MVIAADSTSDRWMSTRWLEGADGGHGLTVITLGLLAQSGEESLAVLGLSKLASKEAGADGG